ncbi:MAG: STAS domain-containing protein [Gammaproteobacteria bacterium]
MAEGQILYARRKEVHCLHFLGEVRYPLAPTLERCLDELLGGGEPLSFAIDLTAVSTIDSTNLGLLARLANRLRQCGGPALTLISDQEDVNELLIALGFDEVCQMVSSDHALPVGAVALAPENHDGAGMAHTVLEAHRTLVKLKESNRELFEDVITLLEPAIDAPENRAAKTAR